ncbi:MAG: NUMOD4 domain-containing protein [Crocinitomicaceae bacterium]|nr:NUMOD4 domain-containing protein [Crocinitomicaceae bacterium]
MKGEWRPIVGFSDYEISSEGEIKSKERSKIYKSGRTVFFLEKLKKLRKHPKNGFVMTDLVDDKGKRRTVYPHKLVGQAFVPNKHPRKYKIVIHIDGNLENNHFENLAWSSYSESFKKSFQNGERDNSTLWEKRRKKYGPKGGLKTMGRPDPLNDDHRREIHRLRQEEKFTLQQLAKNFNCSVSHIHNVLKNEIVREEIQ